MIAMALGLVLLAAFVRVLAHCRDSFAASESVARLEDTARQALELLVPQIEHAGQYGFGGAGGFAWTRGGAVLARGIELQQPAPGVPAVPVTGLPAGAHDCGTNFALDLALAVEGADNAYALGADARDCAPTASAGGARAGTDVLVVRSGSRAPAAAHAGRLQLYSRRLAAHAALPLFADGRVPGPENADATLRDVEVQAFYVANDSIGRAGFPALRRKALTEAGGAAQFRDEELLPGVEDLQFELGLVSAASPETRVRYVAPGFAGQRDFELVAVRLWLRVRSDATEAGFIDARPMSYAGVTFTPSPAEARQRRMLVTRTVVLRAAARGT